MSRFNTIMGALLVALITACGGAPTSDGAAADRDASTFKPETAVREDAPVSQPDVPTVNPTDAGLAPDTQVVADASVPEDRPTVADDRPAVPADDGATMVAAFSATTCARLRTACWRLPGAERCDRIPCEMVPGGMAEIIVPGRMSVVMGYPMATCSGRSCQLQSLEGVPSDRRWEDLSDAMSRFRYTRPGHPDIIVEAD